MEYQLRDVTSDRPDLFPLLERAYDEIYLPAFPDPNEQETLEKFHEILRNDRPHARIVIQLAGTNLDSPKKADVAGLGIAYYYRKSATGLLAYNAVHPEHKGRSIGGLLVKSRTEGLQKQAKADRRQLRAIFLEVNNPSIADDRHDSMDPEARLALFRKWGAREIPIDYVQPPISSFGKHCSDLLLLNYPVAGKYATPEHVRAHLKALYKVEANPDCDSSYEEPLKTMLHQVRVWKEAMETNAALAPVPVRAAAPMRQQSFP